MNYETARQRKSDGRWDWTNARDKQVYVVEPCASHEDGHATADEAARHRWEWEAENAVPMTLTSQHECEVCKTWTQHALRGADGMGFLFLCDEHRDAEGWKAARPFTGNWESMHS